MRQKWNEAPRTNGEVSVRTHTLHALACMPVLAAVTLLPCGSGAARAESCDGVTGDRQRAMRVTLTFLAGTSRAAGAASIARGTPGFNQ